MAMDSSTETLLPTKRGRINSSKKGTPLPTPSENISMSMLMLLVKTGAPGEDESTPLRSGRRLDDSIFESDDQNKYEGSLMKLTAKPIHPSTAVTKGASSDVEMSAIISKYPEGSLDQLKAIQSLINMRKSGSVRETTSKETIKTTYGYDERYLPYAPHFKDAMATGRRRMQVVPGSTPYQFSLRQAVPGPDISEPAKWMLPKMPPEDIDKGGYEDYDRRPTYPSPVSPRRTPVRPSRSTAPVQARTSSTRPTKVVPKILEPIMPRPIDRDLEDFKEKLMLNKYEGPGIKSDEFMRMPKNQNKPEGDYYDEDIKGLPVRRRRHVDVPGIKSRIKDNVLKRNVLVNPDRKKESDDSKDHEHGNNYVAAKLTFKPSTNTLKIKHTNTFNVTRDIISKIFRFDVKNSFKSIGNISKLFHNIRHDSDANEILPKLYSIDHLNTNVLFNKGYLDKQNEANDKNGHISKLQVISNSGGRITKDIDSSAKINAQETLKDVIKGDEIVIHNTTKERLLTSTKQFILELLRTTPS